MLKKIRQDPEINGKALRIGAGCCQLKEKQNVMGL
jgi:hypothetical protein